MSFLKFLFRFLGWLLTPLVAWAASFFGAWLMALAAPTFDDSSIGLVLAVAGGAVGAITATVLWMRLLRGSPELREVLQVTEEGVPVAAVERRHEEHPEAIIEERRHETNEAMRGDERR